VAIGRRSGAMAGKAGMGNSRLRTCRHYDRRNAVSKA
jgi:hypothetical protein